ncbi:unnamed protein product, partial [Rotaria sordida]
MEQKKGTLSQAYGDLFQSKQRIVLLEETKKRKYLKYSINKANSITGIFQVRLYYFINLSSCQDLLQPSLLITLTKRDSCSTTSKALFRTLHVKNNLSNKINVILGIENLQKAETGFKICSRQPWNQHFAIEFDR